MRKSDNLPPLQNSTAKGSPLKFKFPTKISTQNLANNLSHGASNSFSPKKQSPPLEGQPMQRSSLPYFMAMKNHYTSVPVGDFHYPQALGENRNRISWNTILEDACKLEGYKQLYDKTKKQREMEV